MPHSAEDVPPEPDDRSVVLDRDANAWQRVQETADDDGAPPWWCTTPAPALSWPDLVRDRGPLAPLHAEGECPADQFFRRIAAGDERPPSIPETVARNHRAFPAGDEG
jgi:hypothetical protein